MKTNQNKQVAAFDQVLGHCNALGKKYNPSHASIQMTALNALLSSAQSSVSAVSAAQTAYINAVNTRQRVFAPLPRIATRLVALLLASDASPQIIEDIKRYRSRFWSKSSKVGTSTETTDSDVQDKSRGPVSYLDYESKTASFKAIVQLLEGETTFQPTEKEYSLPGLAEVLRQLEAANKGVYDALVSLRGARLKRDEALYGREGLSGIARRVKKYLMFVYGYGSEQFKIVQKIRLYEK